MTNHAFSAQERRAVYRAIAERRGMRRFVPRGTVAPAQLLAMPPGAEPAAILCLGPVPEFPDRPALELDNWAHLRPLADFVSDNTWQEAK